MVFEAILDPVLSPLLRLPPLLSIILVSFVLSVVITLIYKWMTDQELMKTLKEDMKSMQKEMKQLKDNPQKMMEVQKKAMEKNMKYMMHSLKPTLVTFIPLIIIFGWLSTNLAYYPLVAGEQFTVDALFKEGSTGNITMMPQDGVQFQNNNTQHIINDKAAWLMKGEPGIYTLTFIYDQREFYHDILIVQDKGSWEYKNPEKSVKDSNLKTIKVGNEKVIVLNVFGWKIGWLGTYIIFSIVFSMGLRKLLKIH